jgi:hypothetical protein
MSYFKINFRAGVWLKWNSSMPSKCKDLSSKPSTTNNNNFKEKAEKIILFSTKVQSPNTAHSMCSENILK